MRDVDMLGFTREPRVVNSLFGTPKSDGRTRLVIDARPANFHFIAPSPVQLPMPDMLAKLDVPPGSQLYAVKADLKAYYHQLRTPAWMWPFFCLPSVRASEVGLADPSCDYVIYPCCTTLPMGWLHAVLLAQAAHMTVLRRSSAFPPSCQLGPLINGFAVDTPRGAVYIDDFMGFCTNREKLRLFLKAYLDTMAAAGLPIATGKTAGPSTSLEIIGIWFHDNTAGIDPRKLQDLCLETARILARGTVTSRALRRLIGKWSWAILITRPAFAVFQNVYVFLNCHARSPDSRVSLWPSVCVELRWIMHLAPLLFVHLSAQYPPLLLATDASSYGVGVCAAAHASPYVPISLFLHEKRWKVVVQRPWRWPAHINELEMRGVAFALEWYLTHHPGPAASDTLRIFVDSMVVEGAIAKGRSSSWHLLKVLRRITAHLLVSGLRLEVPWISTHIMPADGPSRGSSGPISLSGSRETFDKTSLLSRWHYFT